MTASGAIVNACVSFLMIFGSASFLFGMKDGQVEIAKFNLFFGHYWILFFSGILLGISAFNRLLDMSDAKIRMRFKKVEKELKELKEKL